jgi:hypothetical protein
LLAQGRPSFAIANPLRGQREIALKEHQREGAVHDREALSMRTARTAMTVKTEPTRDTERGRFRWPRAAGG